MNAVMQLFLNSAVVSLLCGIVFGWLFRATMPYRFSYGVALYLVFIIGYKGGMAFRSVAEYGALLYTLIAIVICVGFIQTLIHWLVLKKTTNLDLQTRAVIAAEYGSISIVTFVSTISFLNANHVFFDEYMFALAGIMEIPAIISGLWFIKHYQKNEKKLSLLQSLYHLSVSIITCKKISFIFLGFLIAYGFQFFPHTTIDTLVITPFSAMIVLFMLDIGINIAKEFKQLYEFSVPLIAFGVYMPIINGMFGLVLGSFFIVSRGTLTLFAILLASASYIAVPAIMKSEAPGAKEGIYLPLVLGITLPFNVIIGISLYYYLSQFFII